MQQYTVSELNQIAQLIAAKDSLILEPEAIQTIVQACAPTPGKVEALLRRLRRAANKDSLTNKDVLSAFSAFGMGISQSPVSNGTAKLAELTGVEFERLIESLLACMGFRTELTEVTGDGGIDIIAFLPKPIIGGRYLFQCKRYAPDNLVGAPMIRDFYGAVTADRAVKGVLVTTSSFTAQGREFANKVGIELIELAGLERLLLEYNLIDPTGEIQPAAK